MNENLIPNTDLAEFITANAVKPYSCSNLVSCDLFYDTDWNYRLRVELFCADAVQRDPCFATNACLCNNGYFKVSDAMPAEIPADFTGDSDTIELYKSIK